MGQKYGADPEQLDALALIMSQTAERLHTIRSEIATTLNRTVWFGGDADDFSWIWYQQVSPSLARVATACDDGARTLRVNAEHQRGASSADGGTFQGVTLSPGGGEGDGSGLGESLLDGFFLSTGLAGMFRDGMELLGNLSEGAKLGPGLGGLMKLAREAGDSHVLTGIGVGVDIAELAFHLYEDPGSADSFNSVVSLGLDVVAIGLVVGAVSCPPLTIAVVGATFAFDVVKELDPELPRQVFHGVADAAEDLAEDVVVGVRSLFN
jgi:uncharacterized protein YukE